MTKQRASMNSFFKHSRYSLMNTVDEEEADGNDVSVNTKILV